MVMTRLGVCFQVKSEQPSRLGRHFQCWSRIGGDRAIAEEPSSVGPVVRKGVIPGTGSFIYM